MQTRKNEEKNPKRNREGASTLGMDTYNLQQETSHSKRPRLNPASEQEDTERSAQVTNTEIGRSRPTTPSGDIQEPSTSQTQMLERHISVEVSLVSRPADKDQDIKDRYKEIKMRNEKLKAQIYA